MRGASDTCHEEHRDHKHGAKDSNEQRLPKSAWVFDVLEIGGRLLLAGGFIAETCEQRQQLLASRLKFPTYGALVQVVHESIEHEQKQHEWHEGESDRPESRVVQPGILREERQYCDRERQEVPPKHVSQQPDLMLHLG